MDSLPVNLFDLIVAVVIALSGLIALARGMAKELLKLGAWLGAGVATLYGFAYARPYVRAYVPFQTLADAIAGVGIFIVTLVIFTLIANVISKRVKDSSLSALDRSLGFLFGLVRGGVIVCVGYLLLTWILTPAQMPQWILEAVSRPVVERSVAVLVRLAPRKLRLEAEEAAAVSKARARKAIEAERRMRELTKPPEPQAGGKAPPGYDEDARKEMDRLIRGNQ